MKLVIVFALALVAIVVAVDEPVKIIRSEYKQGPEGGYEYDFETADGTKRQEVGTIKEVLNDKNEPQKVVVVRGTYEFINTEGKSDSVSYYADENGYVAEGESIPKVAK